MPQQLLVLFSAEQVLPNMYRFHLTCVTQVDTRCVTAAPIKQGCNQEWKDCEQSSQFKVPVLRLLQGKKQPCFVVAVLFFLELMANVGLIGPPV